jgi:hypothetical protein
MSARAEASHTVPSEPDTAERASGEAADLAGRLFRQLTVLPALLAMAWLLAGVVLLLLGIFRPVPMLLVALPVTGLVTWLGLRWIPGLSQGPLGARGATPTRTPWWSIAALIAVAVAFGVDQFIYHSQEIIVQRDPASYIQYAAWIAHHGSLPIPQDPAAFGGYSRGVSFHSAAFYQVGHTIVPQFMAGLPMTLAAAFWIGGTGLAVAAGALLGSFGVLAFGGLVGRLVGPKWAPLGALILALSLPEMFTSRATYSEPLVQILFLGGLCLALDSLTAEGRGSKVLAALAGLAIGLTVLVRIDGISDVLPLIPYCGILLIGRRPQAVPLLGGLAVGGGLGLIEGVLLSRPYLHELSGSLMPLLAVSVVVFVLTGVAVLVFRNRRHPLLLSGRWATAAAVVPVVIMLGFVIRPYVQTVRGHRTSAQANAMARIQAGQHLPIQPDRLYYELSMHWVFWYIGVPAVLLATLGAALLTRRCVRGQAPAWTLPLMSFGWIIVTTLLRPSITPDQPWASRRLVPAVLPGFILLAVWATSWLHRWLKQRGAEPVVRVGLVTLLAASVIVPTVRTSFGIAHRSGGPLGIRLVAAGLADKVTFNGEIGAVNGMCAAIPPHSSVVFVSAETSQLFAEVVRGMCGVPTATVQHPNGPQMRGLIADIRGAGRQPVLLGRSWESVKNYGGQPRQVLRLRSRNNPATLTKPPLHTARLKMNIWMLVLPL